MCLRMCLPQVSSPRGEWSLKILQTVWNVLNSDISCTEAEGILHMDGTIWGLGPPKTYWKDVYYACESLRFRETRDPKELKGREGLDNELVHGGPNTAAQFPSQPHRTSPAPHEGEVGGGAGGTQSLARAGDEGAGSGWLGGLWMRDAAWEMRDTLLRRPWLREAGESECACAAWRVRERREGLAEETVLAGSSWQEVRVPSGTLVGKKPGSCQCPSSHLYKGCHPLWSCMLSGSPRPW